MTFQHHGYSLAPGEALEDLDMGEGSVLSLRVTGNESDGRVTVIEGVVRTGGPPLHVHDDEDEVVLVLEGELAYRVGDEEGVLGPRGLLWFPRGVPHAVAGVGDAPTRFVTIVTPSGIEDFFRAQRDYLHSVPHGSTPDPDAMSALPGADTRRVVGPPLQVD